MTDMSSRLGPNDPVVICVGMVAQDQVWALESLPTAAGKTVAAGFSSTGGGLASTAAVAISRLGGRAALWARAGQDAAGATVLDELSEYGVDTRHLRLVEGAQTSISGVLVDAAGERLIVNFRGRSLPASADWLPLSEIAESGAVLADPRWPEAAIAAFTAARKAGVTTVLDAEVSEGGIIEALLPLTDHAIFSEAALARLAGSHDALERVADFGCKVAAVTRGSAGVHWLEDGLAHHCPAFKVAVVDTTGAGDVFHGAWALAVATGATTAAAARFASAAAALKCTRPSGWSGIPELDETMALWRTIV